jgi:hypothetical protein
MADLQDVGWFDANAVVDDEVVVLDGSSRRPAVVLVSPFSAFLATRSSIEVFGLFVGRFTFNEEIPGEPCFEDDDREEGGGGGGRVASSSSFSARRPIFTGGCILLCVVPSLCLVLTRCL